MKSLKLLLGITFLFLTITAFSQWTIDPAAPLIVSDTTNLQKEVQSMPDGNGGLLTFWRDSRTEISKFDIYGQHYNASGIAQWTENGKLIIDGNGNIQNFHVIRTGAGQIILGWVDFTANQSTDNGVFAQKIDMDGDATWSSDLLIKTGNAGMLVTLVESASSLFACMQATVIGGADKIYINKFTDTGNLLWPIDEYNIVFNTQDIGRVSGTSDDQGGVYVYYSTSNGSGALLLCNHLNGSSPGSSSWSGWVDVTSGSAGLSHQFSAIGDTQGVTLCWIGAAIPNTTGINVYSKRLAIAGGNNAWSGGMREICVATGQQDRFYWNKSGSEYFITWADARPGVVGNSAIYARKFNTAGDLFWEENGVAVADLGTYIPYPEFDLDESNTMVICHKANTGFYANKVLSDGTVVWNPEGELVYTNAFAPFYEDYNVVFTGGKFLAIAASSNAGGGADGIYVAEIVESDVVTVPDQGEILPIQVYPNPGSESISVSIDNGSRGNLTVSFYDVQGRVVKIVSLCDAQPCKIPTNNLVPGVYILKIDTDQGVYQIRWMKL